MFSWILSYSFLTSLFFSFSIAQCQNQSLFETFPKLFCDGDAGGAHLTISSEMIRLEFFGGSEPISQLPGLSTPKDLKLVISRWHSGDIRRKASSITIDEKVFTFGKNRNQTEVFRTWFNALQILVQRIEIGNCPIDSKGQSFPEIASVRGSLRALSAVFQVESCI